jgi:hypothetical protein
MPKIKLKSISENSNEVPLKKIKLFFLFFLILVILIIYLYVVYSSGVLNRRIGTEKLALLFSQLSSYSLIYIRVVDMVIPAFLIFLSIRFRDDNRKIKVISFIFILFYLIVSGKIFSKSELVFFLLAIPILYGMLSNLKSVFHPRIIPLIIATVTIFFFISYVRLQTFNGSLHDMLYQDFITRLDGFKLLVEIIKSKTLGLFGEYDISIYKYYLAKIPFIESGVEYKAQALTAAKNYFLSDLLNLSRKDITTTIIVDLFYFGGVLFVSLGAMLLGGVARNVDNISHRKELMNSPLVFSLLYASVFCFGRIEFELFSMMFNFIKVFLSSLIVVYFLNVFLSMGFKGISNV